MQLKEILQTCAKMGQIEIPDQVFSGEQDYRSDPAANRLAFCCNLVLLQLHWQVNKDSTPIRADELKNTVKLPMVACGDRLVPFITAEIFCLGVLAEYFLQIEDFPRFKTWNERYENALTAARLEKNYKQMPVGRWI